MWYEKIKESAKGVFREHPVSIWVFFIDSVLAGVKGDYGTAIGKGIIASVLEFIYLMALYVTPVLVLCEADYSYGKKTGKTRKAYIYAVVTAVGSAFSVIKAYLAAFKYLEIKKSGFLHTFSGFFDRIVFVYLAVCVLCALFLMYKKYGESFEKYALRAFLSLMKAELVYGIILLGAFCIVWVFGALFFSLNINSMVLAVVSGMVGFPASLLALSLPGRGTSKFSNIVMGYVFPGILAAAFVIVYAYIIKILVTWTFPSNQVFSIITALFASGLAFWTMAQGCTEGRVNTLLRVMPLLFIPFIVIQIMCLAMRINQYGITGSRYLGILLIVFEIIYELYYIFRFVKHDGLGGILMPLLLLFVAVYFIVPGINVYAVITNSQKAVIEEFVNLKLQGGDTNSQQRAKAKSAYSQIAENGGLEGERYFDKLYAKSSKSDIESMLGTTINSGSNEVSRSYYVYVTNNRKEFDIEGYKHFACIGNVSARNYVDLKAVEVSSEEDGKGVTAVLDIRDVVRKLKEQEVKEVASIEMSKLINEPVKNENGLFFIEYISFEFDEDYAYEELDDLYIEGFYIYN